MKTLKTIRPCRAIDNSVVALLIGFALIFAFLFMPALASARVPWQWQMSLRVAETGESMYMPSAIAFDGESERYYAVDTGRNRLVSFSREGELLKAFTAEDRLKAPFDMVRMDDGKLWVVEKGQNSLTLIDVAARVVQPNTLKDGERLVFPDRVAADGERLHILDRSSGMVLRLNDELGVEERFGCAECSEGLIDFVIEKGTVVALQPRAKKVYRFNSDGTIAKTIQLGDEVNFPVSLAVGPSGFLYILDRNENSVFVYNGQGQLQYRFLGSGQAPGKVYFARQVRFDPWGRLCVVDEGNGRVEIYGQ